MKEERERGNRDREKDYKYEKGSQEDEKVKRESGRQERRRNNTYGRGTEEDNGRAERERGKRDKEISYRYESGRGWRHLEWERTRDNQREMRWRFEHEDGDKGEHRKREVEEERKGRGKGWHSCQDLEEGDYRNVQCKRVQSNRPSERKGYNHYVKDKRRAEWDDGDGKKRRKKDGNIGQEDSRSLREKEEEGDGKLNEDLKPKK